MDSDTVLFFMLLFALYVIRDLHLRLLPPAPGAPLGVPTGQEPPPLEGHPPQAPRLDPSSNDEEAANHMPVHDADQATVNRDQVAAQAGPAASSLPSTMHDCLQRPNQIGSSASQANVLAVGHPQIAPSSADPGISAASTIGPSLMRNFAGLRVNTTYSFLASQGPRSGDQTPPSSPLSSAPSSPYLSSMCSFQTPVASRVRPSASSNDVDFSLYKKKTRVLNKSPRKASTKAEGKLPAREPANDVTTTTWFYNTSAATQLLDSPPDLTGHPDGLSLGDIYFDSVEDQYQLWLWCLDDVGIPRWKLIPFGYEREDGKRLIVTRKIHFLSWVTTKYYKELLSDEGHSVPMDVDKD